MEKNISLKLDLYADEFPTIWEQGGKGKYSASAVIVSNEKGEKLKHVYVCVCNVGNGRHASYKVEEGYLIGIGKNSNSQGFDSLTIGIYRIKKIYFKKLIAECELVEEKVGQLRKQEKNKFTYWDLICATYKKLNHTQCREPTYCIV